MTVQPGEATKTNSLLASTVRALVANAPAGAQPKDLGTAPRPIATPDRQLHMIGNAHLDPVWLWPWQEGYQEARATFWSVIERMNEYPDFIFTCDQIVLLSWVEEQDPTLFAEIKKRVAEGRWVNVGGWWVEPDNNMPMGESFARQGLYGQRYLESRFGKTATVGMNVDPFGHNVMLPQILRLQGMDSYTFLRPGPHESDFGYSLFWWESPDGSRVLSYRIPFEYCSSPGSVEYQTEKAIASLDRAVGDSMVFYGVGNHGGGPTKANIESIHRYDRMGSFGRMTMSSPRAYFDEVLARGDEFLDSLPVRADDLQHHAAGVYSAHSGIKAWQRRAQYAVLSAERWSAVVALRDGVVYPREDLERAWKQVLFNQFHDILPGSAVEPSYDDARDQLGEAVAISKRLITLAHNVIGRQVDVPFWEGTQPVLVFNPHAWPVATDVSFQFGAKNGGVHVLDETDSPVAHQLTQSTATTADQSRGAVTFRAEVPAFGYRLYRLCPGRAPVPASTSLTVERRADDGVVISNSKVRVSISGTTGWIESYLDLASGRDVMQGVDGTVHTQVCEDPTDTWGHRVVSYNWPGTAMHLKRIVVRETGPLLARVRVERVWGSSTIAEEFVLSHDSEVLRVDVTIDWREQAHLLKMRFPTNLTTPEAVYEIPYGSLKRPVDAAEEPAQSWVDITGVSQGVPAGLTVVTTNKHGYDVAPGDEPSIGITAVRSPVYAWHDPRLLDPDGVYSFQDQGIQRFSYELIQHAGDWTAGEPARRAALLGAPVRAMQESSHRGVLPPKYSFANDGGGVLVTAIKGSEEKVASAGGADLIVRAVEPRGQAVSATIDLPVVGRSIKAEFGASEIKTFRVPADPDAAITEVDLVERAFEPKRVVTQSIATTKPNLEER